MDENGPTDRKHTCLRVAWC